MNVDEHNRLVKKIVTEVVNETLADGGTPTDVVMLTESILVGVVLSLFQPGGEEKAFELIVSQAKIRLARIFLEIANEEAAKAGRH